MKKLLTLMALAAVAFTACEPDSTETNNDNLKIKLTSESVMNFGLEGGEGTITYDFEDISEATRSKLKYPTPEAVTAVEWITDITVHPTDLEVTFNVAANTGSAREATIKVWYDDFSFMVMVKQEGTTSYDQTFTATHLGGTYYGKLQTRGHDYFIILSNMQPESIATVPYGACEYRFDIYSERGAAFETERRVPVGTYTLDHQRTGEPGTIDAYQDCSYMYDNRELAKNEAFKSGTLTVTEDSIIADITLFNGEVHHVEYHGDCIMEDYTEPTFADINPVSQYTSDIEFDVTGGELMPIYRGNWYDSESDVWFVHMIEQRNGFNGVYLLFDLLVPRSNGGFENKDGFVGEYSLLDPKAESWDYTFPAGRLRDDSMQLHAWYAKCVSGQLDMSQAAPITAGSVKVEKAGDDYILTVDGKDDNGNNIRGTFRGKVNTYDNQAHD
ncbi:MAG: hypothetical protein E7135_01475 [Rikenellaceae bacterium]|nr:hypothetical protein [Rikenellaceae bacterium]